MTKNIPLSIIFWLAFCGLFTLFAAADNSDEDQDRYLRLNIGTPELKDKILSVSPDRLYDMSSGQTIEFPQMIDHMMSSRFIYIGETHNSLPMHDIQLKIIQALYEKDKRIAIGLEMIPVTLQHVLNKWSLGILREEELIQDASWYETWNFNFKFYERIFAFAKLNEIPVYGLNIPKELITKIRMRGWDTLTDDEKRIAPQPDVSNQEHRMLIRTIFESSDLPHEMKGPGLDMMFQGLYRAQSAWDESMAYYASRASDLSERRIVVLAGSGHLLYNLGINRRAHEIKGYPFKTVICLEIPDEKGSLRVSQSLADYVWGLNEEGHPAFPSIGLAFKKFEGLTNIVIEREPIDGVAKGGNFAKGDVVLSVDGRAFTEINALRFYLAKFGWNDEVKFRLLREAEEIDVVLKFHPEKSKNDST
jgi:uncharacterized iron-regulated protein